MCRKINKYVKFTFRFYLFLSIPTYVIGRTRDKVIEEAEAYKSVTWTVSVNNILDVGEISGSGANNKIDDRREADIKAYPGEPNKWWPYEVYELSGKTYLGEAYAWGLWDTYTDFGKKIKAEAPYTSQKWIAGKKEDNPGTVSGYQGYTGIDCAGFVSRMLQLSEYHSTVGLESISIPVGLSDLKNGDILNAAGDHVILFDYWIEHLRKAVIFHSVSWKFSDTIHIRRVTDDTAIIERKPDGNIYGNGDGGNFLR